VDAGRVCSVGAVLERSRFFSYCARTRANGFLRAYDGIDGVAVGLVSIGASILSSCFPSDDLCFSKVDRKEENGYSRSKSVVNIPM
jgi:hypothetical protein